MVVVVVLGVRGPPEGEVGRWCFIPLWLLWMVTDLVGVVAAYGHVGGYVGTIGTNRNK